jgi:hypothetical protein
LIRRAKESADRGGLRPKIGPLQIGVLTAVAVFCLLDVFAAVTLPDRNAAFWPAAILTVLCAGGAAAIQWRRERNWLNRYNNAIQDIGAIRRGTSS